MILTVTLNPAFDLSYEVTSWELGGVNRALDSRNVFGGKGINVSRVLSELGAESLALTLVGADSIPEFHRLRSRERYSIRAIEVAGKTRTNVSIVDVRDGKILKVNHSGAEVGPREYDEFLEAYRAALQEASAVFLGGSLPPGLGADTYGELVRLARRAGVAVVLDAEGEALRAGSLEGPWVAKPNRAELAAMLGSDTLGENGEVVEAARALQSSGPEAVVVTGGPAPAVGVWRGEAWTAEAPPVRVRGTTGAGDSFAAGLLFGCLQQVDFGECLRMAMACGAAACMTPETRLVARSDYEDLLPRIQVRRLEKD